MFKIIKYFKPFTFSIILILVLLFLQATCDLALPEYMSDIVNVGIQQKGIENPVPNILRETEYQKIKLFLDAEDKKVMESAYTLLETGQSEYVDQYPLLSQEPLYRLNDLDDEGITQLIASISKAELVVYGLETKGFAAFGEGASEMGNIPEGSDPFQVFAMLPQEQLATILDKMGSAFDAMPEMMITQGANAFVIAEYQAIGIDIDKMQSDYIILAGLKMIGIALLSMLATVIVTLIASRVAAGLGRNLRGLVFRKVTHFSNAEFDKFSTASLITRTTNDIQQVQTLMVMMLRIVFYAPILGVGGVIKVLATDTGMGWIIAVAVMSIMSLVAILFAFAIPKFKGVQKLMDNINLISRESLVGMMVIRAFNTQKHEEKRFEKANKNLTDTTLFVSRMMTIMMPMMFLIMNLIIVLIVWVGAHQVDDGAMQVGDMMAFMQYTMQIIMAFLMIAMVSIMLPRASVSAARIAEVLKTEVTIHDPKESKPSIAAYKGVVEFKNVSFKYPGADEDVLSNISFVAQPGKTTAFIGSTGAGKSTLINLIPRFYDATTGEVMVDGVNIREYTQHDLRAKLGYVPQKGVLFSGTIESNILFGSESASPEEMKKAAEIAQAIEFIEEKTEGYLSEISQGGTNVSGGQKQRLSIARALAKKPDIFIFDDSFSALDYKTDVTLRKALSHEIGNATLLIVAQRISTIMKAEQIIVLDDGKIVGKGTHNELMVACEVYKEIAYSQLSKEELSYE